jgi:acetyl esterase/lipase
MEAYAIDPVHQHPNSIALLDQFRTFRTPYKHINNQPIHAFFIVPDKLPPGPRPLFVRFHGGGFVEGEAEASMRPL